MDYLDKLKEKEEYESVKDHVFTIDKESYHYFFSPKDMDTAMAIIVHNYHNEADRIANYESLSPNVKAALDWVVLTNG